MSNKIEVDICIISYAKTKELAEVTRKGVSSLLFSENDIHFNVFVVESNKAVNYDDMPNTTTIYTDEVFGYNKYLNIAVSKGNAPYVFLANNDLTYEKGWASEIIKQMWMNPSILSASPFCPQIHNPDLKQIPFICGNGVRKQLCGWAIFQKREIYSKIGKLNEGVDFWFSDNIYVDQLIKHNILHGLATNSVVNHHDKNLGITGITTLNNTKLDEFTTGQYNKYVLAKETIM